MRDADGTVHTVPSSEIKVVSNLTRDWTQINLQVSVAYAVDSDRVIGLLKQVGEEIAHDPAFADMIVATTRSRRDRQGERKRGGLPDAGKDQARERSTPCERELQRRIKACFETNHIEPGDPSRVIVAGISKPS